MVIMRIWLESLFPLSKVYYFPSLNGFGVDGNIISGLTVSLINMGLFEDDKRRFNAPQN
jgi:hypothetical protein